MKKYNELMKLPRLLLVNQNFPDRAIRDIPSTVRKELAAAPFSSRLKPGARVAIGVGSRGITNIATIVRSAVDYWKSQGMLPFIFPAMGSPGAATAEGQADVLFALDKRDSRASAREGRYRPGEQTFRTEATS